jgi:hypothetical protein
METVASVMGNPVSGITSGAGKVVVGPVSSDTSEPSPYPGSVSDVVELPPHAASAKPPATTTAKAKRLFNFTDDFNF